MLKNNRIQRLIAFRLSAMGDVAITVPVLEAFAKAYPEIKLIVVTKSFFTPVFDHLKGIQVVAVDVKERHQGIIGLKKLAKELAHLKPDAFADLHDVLRSKAVRTFLRWKVSGLEIGVIDKGRKEKKALTRSSAKSFKPLKTSAQRYADVFAKLGFALDLSNQLERKVLALSKKTIKLSGSKDHNWVGVAPFAAHLGKQYPTDLMQEVLTQCSSLKNTRIFLFGAPGEEAQRLTAWANSLPNTLNMAGKLSFKEELTLISNLDLMLAMDSGNAHLAAMYGVPTITLWGVTHPYAGFAPYGQEKHVLLADRKRYPRIPTSVYGNQVPEGYEDAMRTIKPEQVVDKLKSVLEHLD
ncbi:glycosyltransferase family 9 protein [Croceiramulus getboli]|nr:glycosyltransferase family 9 protein [Flavobacteriaceae bacterium YJPT1-3]